MKEPFANLDTNHIDEQIEQFLQTIPAQQDGEESRCLRDLSYLYRKEEILARAHQRLMIVDQPDQTLARGYQKASSSTKERMSPTMVSLPQTSIVRKPFSWTKMVAVLAAALLLISAIVETTSFFSTRTQQTLGTGHKGSGATATTTAPSTPAGTILFSDPLSQNVHNWPVGNLVGNLGQKQTAFKDGSYHITNQGNGPAAVVSPQQTFPQTTLSYQLTMEEVAGDDSSFVNTFGMILRYTTQTVGGRMLVTFYAFTILNEDGKSQYVFYKYDSRSAPAPWTQVGKTMKAGKEFRSGQGPDAANTVKISINGNSFAFSVNGRLVGTATDASPLQSGQVGMLVYLKGTEVAFSNLLITQP
ncbi:hypothetical protein KSC_103200 [Ktedonobacter sp. SOSP1-52]|uniref:hypothetical protein n=1 Tax=Ktedonobacter sp. SOSP1-52 TaxID=2778366 RepID=UPI001916B328|nr:hypothetical protein [Ktedonobacter sp. SOSP1-52]GHO61155.1 hypothetical protein KSC_000470 [Ktedonobacter sp. SOSP1-52]GHO71428.1 hypothetical protein KSC_103200 [Ktedonobacter sp. SOSP1-52]